MKVRAIHRVIRSGFSLVLCLIALSTESVKGQYQSDSVNTTRLTVFLVGTGVAYTSSLIALNNLWYSDFPKENFHFFNDFGEWKQMDKIGHVYSTFQLSHTSSRLFMWSGVSRKKSAIYGTIMGSLMMIPIELMDGFSSEYGASASDLGANFLGAGLYLGQELLWQEVRIHPKFSFYPSGLNDVRPQLLGRTFNEQLIKDYNGQTYWLSFDLYSLFFKKEKFIPWLNLAFGYGVQNMVTSSGGPYESFNATAYRQYYLGIDFDLTYLKGKNKVVNTLIYFVNMIKLPAPALEYNSENKFIFHPLHF